MIVNQTNPVSIVFSVEHCANWDTLLFERVKGHFNSYGLSSLYAIQAARELSGIKHQLVTVFNSGAGCIGIKKLLSESATSRSMDNKNAWQAAFYSGLSLDNWFCDGGFRQIG